MNVYAPAERQLDRLTALAKYSRKVWHGSDKHQKAAQLRDLRQQLERVELAYCEQYGIDKVPGAYEDIGPPENWDPDRWDAQPAAAPTKQELYAAVVDGLLSGQQPPILDAEQLLEYWEKRLGLPQSEYQRIISERLDARADALDKKKEKAASDGELVL